MTWNTYYTGTQSDVEAANAQINSNCGFPDACTDSWAIPEQAYEQDFWFILMPSPEGYMTDCGSWTQVQMIAGVSGVEQQQSQSNWWPPHPVPPGGE